MGNNIGIVFEGGGGDAGRMIGALRAIVESGYEPDYMSGSSIGGIISGVYMSLVHHENLEPIEAVEKLEEFWIKLRVSHIMSPTLLSYPLPRLFIWKSLSRNTIDDVIINFLGKDYDITNLPVAMTATDLKKSEQVLIENEMLSRASKMTANIPGIFEPIDGKYVDGGVSGNTPIHYVKDKCDKVTVVRAGINKSDDIGSTLIGNVFRSWMVSIGYFEKFAIDYFRDKFDEFKVIHLGKTGDSGILELTEENAKRTIKDGYDYTRDKLS